MSSSPLIEKTVILAKHDCLQRGLVGELIRRFEQRGFRLAAMKMVLPTEELLGQHYADDKEWKISVGKKTIEVMAQKGIKMTETEEQIGDRIRAWNMAGLRGGPIVAMLFEGFHAIEVGRKIVGATEPRAAVPGSFRGDYSTESYEVGDTHQRVIRNMVHASGNKKEADREVKIWFNPEDVFDWTRKDWEVMHK